MHIQQLNHDRQGDFQKNRKLKWNRLYQIWWYYGINTLAMQLNIP